MFTVGNLRDFFASLPQFDLNEFPICKDVVKHIKGNDDDPISTTLESYYTSGLLFKHTPDVGVLLGDDLNYSVTAKSLSKTSVYIRITATIPGCMSQTSATQSGIIPRGKYTATIKEECERVGEAIFPDAVKAIERAFGRPNAVSKGGTFVCKKIRNLKIEHNLYKSYIGVQANVFLSFTMNFAPAVVASKRDIIESKKLTANTMLTNYHMGKLFEVLSDKDCEFFGIESGDFTDISDAYFDVSDEAIKRGEDRVLDETAYGRVVEYNIVHGDPDVAIDVTNRGDEVLVYFMASVGMLDLETINADDLSEPMSESDYAKYAKADTYSVYNDYVKPFERGLKSLSGTILREAGLKLTSVKSAYDYDEEDGAYFTCLVRFDVV